MEQGSSLLVVFIGLLAIATLIESLAFLGIYFMFKELSRRLSDFAQEASRKIASVSDSVVEVSRAASDVICALKPIAEQIQTVNNNIASMMITFRDRAEELDKFIAEATDAARLQIAKIDDTISSITRKLDDAATTLQRGIIAPVTEVYAVSKGIRAALNFFLKRQKDQRQAAQDEGLFI